LIFFFLPLRFLGFAFSSDLFSTLVPPLMRVLILTVVPKAPLPLPFRFAPAYGGFVAKPIFVILPPIPVDFPGVFYNLWPPLFLEFFPVGPRNKTLLLLLLFAVLEAAV